MNYYDKMFWWSIMRFMTMLTIFTFAMFYTEFWTWHSTHPEYGYGDNIAERIPAILLTFVFTIVLTFIPFEYFRPDPKGMNEPDKIDTKCYCGCHQMKNAKTSHGWNVVCGICYRSNCGTLPIRKNNQ